MDKVRCLDTAKEIVTKDRQNTYGKPEDNFGIISTMWSAYLGHSVTPTQVATMMILLKIARQKTSPQYEDNYVDMAGYAACAAEIAGGFYGTTEDYRTVGR